MAHIAHAWRGATKELPAQSMFKIRVTAYFIQLQVVVQFLWALIIQFPFIISTQVSSQRVWDASQQQRLSAFRATRRAQNPSSTAFPPPGSCHSEVKVLALWKTGLLEPPLLRVRPRPVRTVSISFTRDYDGTTYRLRCCMAKLDKAPGGSSRREGS
ncbi:hypothetical protein BC835DRAFT_854212 [Cytidiella melzeri]|nr:hypothetical protein BC835DRAFT_854212 [Cytidiella melzeri]